MVSEKVEIAVKSSKIPSIDFAYQLNLTKDKVEKKVFSHLCEIAEKLHREDKRLGILIVCGHFGTGIVEGMRKLGQDRVEKYINVIFPQFKEDVMKILEEGNDGAIILNQDGQVLGNKIYLTVEDPSVEIPEGTGTRHLTAASFSTRSDVLFCATLSEENRIARIWHQGTYTEQYDPSEVDSEPTD